MQSVHVGNEYNEVVILQNEWLCWQYIYGNKFDLT